MKHNTNKGAAATASVHLKQSRPGETDHERLLGSIDAIIGSAAMIELERGGRACASLSKLPKEAKVGDRVSLVVTRGNYIVNLVDEKGETK